MLQFQPVEPMGLNPKKISALNSWKWNENTLTARIGNLKLLRYRSKQFIYRISERSALPTER